MDNVCKNCRWWKQHDDGKRGNCDRVDFRPLREKHDDRDETNFCLDVRVDDDHNLQVDLVTWPLFGCVKFEPR